VVFKVLSGGVSVDMYNVADQFGYFDDTVYAVFEGGSFEYGIRTYRGNDLVDLQDASLANTYTVFSGSGNDTILGGLSFDYVRDQSGNDVILLGGGKDSVTLGQGNDRMDGGSGSDVLLFGVFHDDFGVSYITTTGITCDLQKTVAQDFGIFGKDRIAGFERIDGSAANDIFLGSSADNDMLGNDGNDRLSGRGGADTIYGNDGGDTLSGDGGADFVYCGLDDFRDVVRFGRMSDSGLGTAGSTVDQISGFDPGTLATDDRIDLSRIDARPSTAANDAFLFRGTGAFSSARGEVRLEVSGSDTIVHMDTDGDAASEMDFMMIGVTGLTTGDFIL
jgi:Ca2+-binding RTX toxin-like protein